MLLLPLLNYIHNVNAHTLYLETYFGSHPLNEFRQQTHIYLAASFGEHICDLRTFSPG